MLVLDGVWAEHKYSFWSFVPASLMVVISSAVLSIPVEVKGQMLEGGGIISPKTLSGLILLGL